MDVYIVNIYVYNMFTFILTKALMFSWPSVIDSILLNSIIQESSDRLSLQFLVLFPLVENGTLTRGDRTGFET